jgi:hypothetical protein
MFVCKNLYLHLNLSKIQIKFKLLEHILAFGKNFRKNMITFKV